MKKTLAIVLCIVMCAALLAACGSSAKPAAAEEKTLIVATNVAFPPYEYYENEKAVGIDIDIMQAICDKLGYKMQVDDMEFGSIIIAVQTGKADVGAGGLTITEERKQSVDFATPYETTVQMIITLKGSELTEGAQLEAEGASYKIAVQQDTTGDYYASDLETAGKATVERYKSAADAVLALTSGKVDCVVVDGGPAAEFVARDDTLTTFESACTKEEYGFCFAKDNTELFEAFDAALKEMLADGTVDAVFAKYKG